MRAKGFLDFSMDRLTERNKENSFLDVDWIIEELLSLGQHRISNESTSTTPEMTSPSNVDKILGILKHLGKFLKLEEDPIFLAFFCLVQFYKVLNKILFCGGFCCH